MTKLAAPTCEQLMEEELPCVQRSVEDGWRHGVTVTEVYKREEDNTFWQAVYRKTPDGDTNELREGYAHITEVYPVTETIIRYEPVQLDEAFRPKKKK